MATFAAYVIVHGDTGPVQFSPGDELPDWADSLVGDHVLTEPREESVSDADEDETPPADPPADAPKAEPVDFTGAKPAQRRARG